jgi:hypothetical protein
MKKASSKKDTAKRNERRKEGKKKSERKFARGNASFEDQNRPKKTDLELENNRKNGNKKDRKHGV